MKRFAFVLLVILTLTGCARNIEPDTEPTTETTTALIPTGLYVENSTVEEQTNGAVKMYDLPDSSYIWLAASPEYIYMASKAEAGGINLSVYTGDICAVHAFEQAPDSLTAESRWSVTNNGLIYYDPRENQAVVLDSRLSGNQCHPLPQMDGEPLFSQDGSSVYYCLGNEIRVYDLDNRIDRLLKVHTCQSQTLLRSYFSGQLLACEVTLEDGDTRVVYVSADTGETVNADQHLTELFTMDDRYLALRREGVINQRIFGTQDTLSGQLVIPQDSNLTAALAAGGAVQYSVDEAETLKLRFYNLISGKMTGSVDIEKVGEPILFLDHKATKSLWFVGSDPQTGEQALFQWDPSASACDDAAVYTSVWFNASSPDKEALDALQDRVKALNKTHGVDIRIWDAAVEDPGEFTLEIEHQPLAISMCLDSLEQALLMYPENFLYKSVNSKIRICIVRSISGEISGKQYWYDGDAYIALAVGCDVADELAKAMGYVVDSHVLGNSPLLDEWNELNPAGFLYGGAVIGSMSQGDQRAFYDDRSMSSATEDRSIIFWQAMKPDNGDVFTSDIMQRKLRQLCLGIRDAWRWEKKTEVYPWEQYLNSPVAYTQ